MAGNESNLRREKQPMPDFVRFALMEAGLMDVYEARPPYQRNDYLLWINQAKRHETKEKRLRQVLHELKVGGVYMNMRHRASSKGQV